MSKTPRTDAILQTLDDPWGGPISNDIIRAITKDISSLEIELTKVTHQRNAYKKALEMAEDELMTVRAEIESLKLSAGE